MQIRLQIGVVVDHLAAGTAYTCLKDLDEMSRSARTFASQLCLRYLLIHTDEYFQLWCRALPPY